MDKDTALQEDNDSTENQEENSEVTTEEKSTNVSFSFFLYRLIAYADARRSVASFVIILFLVTFSDILFENFLFVPYVELVESLSGVHPGGFAELDVGFAPEVWQALLGMVLGTLILVISIASQSIPKLIDFYMRDPFTESKLLYRCRGISASNNCHNTFVSHFRKTLCNCECSQSKGFHLKDPHRAIPKDSS